MGKINSKQKGKTGELEVSHYLKDRGFDARRGQQFSGGDDSPDVVHSIEGIHIEVKRTEKLQLYKFLKQAITDAKDKIPTIWHRQNKQEWVVILRAEDFIKLIEKTIDNNI